jgi:hypothetical protein
MRDSQRYRHSVASYPSANNTTNFPKSLGYIGAIASVLIDASTICENGFGALQRCSMKFPKTALVAGSLLFLLTARIAAQEQAVLGQGNVSCSSWLENHRSDDVQGSARTAWILGYITAFNQYGSKSERDVTEGKSTEEMTAWIDNYCKHHPAENLYRASAALVDEFKQKTGR